MSLKSNAVKCNKVAIILLCFILILFDYSNLAKAEQNFSGTEQKKNLHTSKEAKRLTGINKSKKQQRKQQKEKNEVLSSKQTLSSSASKTHETSAVQTQGHNNLVLKRRLSWEQVLELTQTNHPDLIQSKMRVQAAESRLKSMKEGFWPHLSGELSALKSQVEGQSESLTYDAELKLTQNLWNGGADYVVYKKYSSKLKEAQLEDKLTKSKVSLELKTAYQGLLYAQGYLELWREVLKRRRENLNNVKLQYESGRENKGALLLTESYVAQGEYEEMTSENLVSLSMDTLRRMMGFSAEEEFEVYETIPGTEVDKPVTIPIYEALIQDHLQLQLAVAQSETAKSTSQQVLTHFSPSLDLKGQLLRSGDSFFPGQDEWRLRLTLSVPLFDGFKDVNDYKSKLWDYKISQNQVEDKKKSLLIDLRSAYQKYCQSVKAEQVQESFVKAAKVRAEIYRSRYQAGLIWFDTWNDVESELVSSLQSHLDSQKERVVSQALWEQAQGLGVFK